MINQGIKEQEIRTNTSPSPQKKKEKQKETFMCGFLLFFLFVVLTSKDLYTLTLDFNLDHKLKQFISTDYFN